MLSRTDIALVALAGAAAIVFFAPPGTVPVLPGVTRDPLPGRPIRRNNPGNIRYNSRNKWIGQVGSTRDGFVVFNSPFNGVRAISRLLRNYQLLYGDLTIRQIITRYAPPRENDTDAYISFMANRLQVDPDRALDLVGNYDLMVQFIKGIIRFEQGYNGFSDRFILDAVYASV